MSDPFSLQDLDLRFIPDWMREDAGGSPSHQAFAGSHSESDGSNHASRDRGPRKPQGGKGKGPTSFQDRGRRGGEGPRGGAGPRPAGAGDRTDRRPSSPRPAGRNETSQRPDKKPRDNRPPRPGYSEPLPPKPDVPVTVRLLPEERFVDAVISRLKTTLVTFPLFSLGRLFLQDRQRYTIAISCAPEAGPIHMVPAAGVMGLDLDWVRQQAFDELFPKFYREEVTEGEEIKGNYSAVARCRLNNEILGPTNHHAYQMNLRRCYEKSFSRRMSFDKFKANVDIVTDHAAVEEWKTQARRKTIYRPIAAGGEGEAQPEEAPSTQNGEAIPTEEVTTDSTTAVSAQIESEGGAEPTESATDQTPAAEGEADVSAAQEGGEVSEGDSAEASSPNSGDSSASEAPALAGPAFASRAECLNDFAQNHLPALIFQKRSVKLEGTPPPDQPQGWLLDGQLKSIVDYTLLSEEKLPIGIGRLIGDHCQKNGLHIFKFNKRIVSVGAVKAQQQPSEDLNLADGVRRILGLVSEKPGRKRRDLAKIIIGRAEPPAQADENNAEIVDFNEKKLSLLRDLHFAISSGWILEFSNGELHPTRIGSGEPQPQPKAKKTQKPGGQQHKKGAQAAQVAAAVALASSAENPKDPDQESAVIHEEPTADGAEQDLADAASTDAIVSDEALDAGFEVPADEEPATGESAAISESVSEVAPADAGEVVAESVEAPEAALTPDPNTAVPGAPE